MPAHDLKTRAILWTGAAFLTTVVVSVVAVLSLLHWWDMPPGGERVPLPHPSITPVPRLQSAPQQDLAAYRMEKQRWLASSAWIDRPQGIARIPIEDAMDLLAHGAAAPASQPRGAQ